ncbi:APC family permease [Nocardia sp. CA-119907]|uniref:APC family permease n=1 Tax=Nocardia sp. CA-119907 TaxID=3239973 RepID=UPI003D9988C9
MATSEMTPEARSDLKGDQLSAFNLTYLVLAAVAPLAAVVSAVPLVILGVGVGAPGMYVATSLVLLFFAIGYTKMSRHVNKPGAFYAYITLGLGPWVGMAAAAIAATCYCLILVGIAGITSGFATSIFESVFDWSVPAPVWAAVVIVLIGFTGRRGVELNARILTVVFTIEILLVLTLDATILVRNGFGAFSLDVFNPSNVFSGAPGIAFAFAASSFMGFEATAIYYREAKDPLKTVPRATFAAVGLVSIFLILASWSLIAGNGGSSAQSVAEQDPARFVFATMHDQLGSGGETIMELLFLISFMACAMSTLNAAARYVYSLSRDKLLPSQLGRVHSKHASPYVASAVLVVFAAAILTAGFLSGLDPYLVIGVATVGLATVGIISLQAVVCIAAIAYFWRRPERNWWTTVIAPALGAAGMTTGVVLTLANWDLIGTTSVGYVNNLPWLLLVVVIAMLAYGARLRRKDRASFDRFASSAG